MREILDREIKKYENFRAEGLPLKDSFYSFFSYFNKYYYKSFFVSPKIKTYLDQQCEIIKYLKNNSKNSNIFFSKNAYLAMLGDIMWVRNQWDTFVSQPVIDHLNLFDVVVGNLETTIASSKGIPEFLPDYIKFNSPSSLITGFKKKDKTSSFTALGTANNHIFDHKDQGVIETLDFLDSQKILHSGVRKKNDKPYVTFEKNGICFGFYSATWGVNDPVFLSKTKLNINLLPGIAPLSKTEDIDLSQIQSVLQDMQQEKVQFKIISLHWGFEFELYPDPRIMELGRKIAQMGADVIIGTHPHVLQPCEVCFLNGYESRLKSISGLAHLLSQSDVKENCILESADKIPRKTLICYSLGNFKTTMYTLLCQISVILGLEIFAHNNDPVADWNFLSSVFVYNKISSNRKLLLLNQKYLSSLNIKKRMEMEKNLNFLCQLRVNNIITNAS